MSKQGSQHVPSVAGFKSFGGLEVTSEASPILQMRDKILEGLGALKAAHEALLDVAEITATLIQDIEFALDDFEHYDLKRKVEM